MEQLSICLELSPPTGVMDGIRQGWEDGCCEPVAWIARLLGRAGRPHPPEIEAALRRACSLSVDFQEVWGRLLEQLVPDRRLPPVSDLLEDFRSDAWRRVFLARQLLFRWGGEAVAALLPLAAGREWSLQSDARCLLRSIEADTRRRLGRRPTDLLCPSCLVRCDRHRLENSAGMAVVFYGCRACRQSREFWHWPGDVVAVLDPRLPEGPLFEEDVLWVNALRHVGAFDFDSVYIGQVADLEVERFVLRVGNDTDAVRRRRYRDMWCQLLPEAHLCPNTLRILRRVFGRLQMGSR